MAVTALYNFFGATRNEVIELFPAEEAANFGGNDAIDRAMNRQVTRLLTACPQFLRESLDRVEAEIVEDEAAGGETEYYLGGSWNESKNGFTNIVQTTNVKVYKNYVPIGTQLPGRIDEEESTEFTVGAGGAGHTDEVKITLTTALSEGDCLMVSYDFDTTNANYRFERFAHLVILGAAIQLGSWRYNEDLRIEQYVAEFDAAMERVQMAQEGPHELARLRGLRAYVGYVAL